MLVLAASVSFSAAPLAGVARADVPSEYTPPSGAYAGRPARGLVIVLHYGAWHGGDGRGIPVMRPWASEFNRHGWAAVNTDYRTGADSILDVVDTYDRWRAQLGPRIPICAYGQSAGGHLALMLAAIRPALDCVIAAAAPTDFQSLRHGHTAGNKWVVTVARQFWSDLRSWSPVHWVKSIHATVGLDDATNDHWIPFSQGRELARRLPGTRLTLLHPGHVRWVHSYVSPDSMARARRADLRILDMAADRAGHLH
jgi:fermentation-respiration switch protein FrsA (DUF1100 family)